MKSILKKVKKASLLGGRLGGGLLLLLACSESLYTHEAAREAAEQYYTMLINGDYQGFVNGYADSLPDGYRSQLVDATAQFMAGDNMRSLCSVTALGDTLSEDSTAVIMLQLQFTDSTTEQIELPLVLMEEGWKMRTP